LVFGHYREFQHSLHGAGFFPFRRRTPSTNMETARRKASDLSAHGHREAVDMDVRNLQDFRKTRWTLDDSPLSQKDSSAPGALLSWRASSPPTPGRLPSLFGSCWVPRCPRRRPVKRLPPVAFSSGKGDLLHSRSFSPRCAHEPARACAKHASTAPTVLA